ncbi:MAG TPA: SDR family oxidoreductase [Vicinamibacterales bacterium]|nr:SDR family oxidoreductase [Vicinamibacterales bacterium]
MALNTVTRTALAVSAVACALVATLTAQQPASAPASAAGTVLITGSNRGLGLEFAKQYAARGWKVIATARDPQAAADLRALAAKNNNVTVDKLDVEDRAAIKALAARYRGTPIDVLINNAGVLGDMKSQAAGALDYAQFEEVMAINVYGALAIAEAFRDHVAASRQKKIVSITSRSGIISQPGYRGPSFYRASKVALNMTMRVLADELRDRGVIVALVSPPPTETDMLRQLIGPENAARQGRPGEVISMLIKVIDGLTMENSGGQPVYFDGTLLPW